MYQPETVAELVPQSSLPESPMPESKTPQMQPPPGDIEPVPSRVAERVMPRSAEEWISFQLHREALERFVPSGARVLEVNPGSGQFTEVLHRHGCKVTVLSASESEREALRQRAESRGFATSIAGWLDGDITKLEAIGGASFDVIVAYGGALSFALERRDRALSEMVRLLEPRGVLLLSVMSLWGTLHRNLPVVLARDLVDNRAVVRSGNAPGEVFGHPRPCHLFRAAELEAFVRRGGLEVVSLSASSALSTGALQPLGEDPSGWSALLEFERAACAERGYLDSGGEIIAVGRR